MRSRMTVVAGVPLIAFGLTAGARGQCLVQELDTGGAPAVFFGAVVAIDGDRIYAGDPKGTTDQGRVYVYEFDGEQWQPIKTLVSQIDSTTDSFPTDFAFHGDTVLIANRNTVSGVPGADAGAIEVFDRETLEPLGIVVAPEPGLGGMGLRVSVEEDWMLVGAPLRDTEDFMDVGAVIAYQWDGKAWIARQVIENQEPIQFAGFGSAIAFVKPDYALIGAHGGIGNGLVQAFRIINGQWTHIDTIIPPALPGPSQWFGRSIAALDDQTVLIGSPQALDDPIEGGAAHQYAFAGEWVELQTIIPSNPSFNAFFGGTPTISSDGGHAAIDAPSDTETQFSEGAVYVFDRDERGLFKERIKILAPPGSDGFGTQALQDDLAAIGAGKVFVYRGFAPTDCNGNGLPDACDVVEGRAIDRNNNFIPDACECPGDVDGDGGVDSIDLNLLLGGFADALPPPAPGIAPHPADFDADGDIDSDDLNTLLAAFASECEGL